MKNILVIGSEGYLGKHIVKSLNELKFNLTKCDIKPVCNDTFYLDMSDQEKVEEFFTEKHFDVIICLAGLLPGKKPSKNLYNNNLSSVSFLKFIDSSTHVVFASSTAVYQNKYTSEFPQIGPFEIYGKSKLDCEKKISNNCDNFTILRLGTIISKNRSGGIMIFLNRIIKNKLIWLPNKGNLTHPFIHINDVVDVFTFLCNNTKLGIFDIISKERINLYEYAKKHHKNPKIISSFILDKLFKTVGSDNFPLMGISKWHLNALSYDLKNSSPENKWDFTDFKTMTHTLDESALL